METVRTQYRSMMMVAGEPTVGVDQDSMTTNSCISAQKSTAALLTATCLVRLAALGSLPQHALSMKQIISVWPRQGEGGSCLQETGEGKPHDRGGGHRSRSGRNSVSVLASWARPVRGLQVLFFSPSNFFFKPLSSAALAATHRLTRSGGRPGLARREEPAGGAGQGRASAKSLCICIVPNPGRAETSRTLPRHTSDVGRTQWDRDGEMSGRNRAKLHGRSSLKLVLQMPGA
jgi:hypothetical protein